MSGETPDGLGSVLSLGSLLEDLVDECLDIHSSEVSLVPAPDGKVAVLDLLLSDDEHVGCLLELSLTNLVSDLLVPVVDLTAGKKDIKKDLEKGYKNVISIAIGYGETQGIPHKSKPIEHFADVDGAPEWFVNGVKSAMLAPTGMNKQDFRFERDGDKVHLVSGKGKLRRIDEGIVRYHFECGAGKENFVWD